MTCFDCNAESSSSFLTSCVQFGVTAIMNLGFRQVSYAVNPIRKSMDVSLLEEEVNHITMTIATSQNKSSVTRSVLLQRTIFSLFSTVSLVCETKPAS